MVHQYVVDHGIKFNFIPPHQDSLWELGIKLMKHNLIRVIGNIVLTIK